MAEAELWVAPEAFEWRRSCGARRVGVGGGERATRGAPRDVIWVGGVGKFENKGWPRLTMGAGKQPTSNILASLAAETNENVPFKKRVRIYH